MPKSLDCVLDFFVDFFYVYKNCPMLIVQMAFTLLLR